MNIEQSTTLNPAQRNLDWNGPSDGTQVSFTPGETYADMVFKILPDAEVEDTECFHVRFIPPFQDSGELEDSIRYDEPLESTVCIADETSKAISSSPGRFVLSVKACMNGTMCGNCHSIRVDGKAWAV